MDKIVAYTQIIEKVLKKHAAMTPENIKTINAQVIIDQKKEHFLLIDSGWHHHKFIHNLIFHLQIKNQKIWVLQDRSDIGIAEELTKNGIDKSNIVIGFLAPYVREESGFAIV